MQQHTAVSIPDWESDTSGDADVNGLLSTYEMLNSGVEFLEHVCFAGRFMHDKSEKSRKNANLAMAKIISICFSIQWGTGIAHQ